MKKTVVGAALISSGAAARSAAQTETPPLRLGGPTFEKYNGPEEWVRVMKKLGPYLKSCHAKDILLDPKLTTHLDEVRPGLGGLDYAVFLKELSKIPDTPLMLEHLKGAEQYRLAAEHIRGAAKEVGLSFG
ncbi:MAG: hypothetical protein U9Q07_11485 [Planctomycetota bacterium]|nr:hypothetical protein [Planctomycetota bacterium]